MFTDLFSREDEQDVGHIRLAREHDLIVIAPATASLMAKMAAGIADDLAGAILLARDCPVLMAPAMNPKMWSSAPTQRNLETLKSDGVMTIGPMAGEMAESGEAGTGRMAEPLQIVEAVEAHFDVAAKPLAGKRAIVTSGPTHERSTQSATSPTGPPANRATRLPRLLPGSAPTSRWCPVR